MRVAYKIVADGQDVTGNFSDRLIAMTVIDEVGQKSDTATIELDDRDFAIALPEVGAKLQLALGFEGELVDLGLYVVDEFSGNLAPSTLTIKAKAADMLGGIRARKTRAWRAVTIEDIVNKIAGEHGLKPQISDSLKDARFTYLAQTGESDLNFLTRIAKDMDAIAKPAGGYLVFARRGEGKAADGSDLPVFAATRSQMQDLDWTITGRGRYGRVIAEWSDPATNTVHKVQEGDKEPELRLRHRYASKDEAQRAAQSALETSKRASGKVSVALGGFWGDLLAGAKVSLGGVKPEIEGEWNITRVEHTLSNTLTTRFEAERDNEA